MTLYSLMLMAMAVYVPEQLHFPTSFGVKGLNTYNLMLLLLVLGLAFRKDLSAEEGYLPGMRPPVARQMYFLFATILLGLAIALARRDGSMIADITVAKNHISYMLLFLVYFYAVRDIRLARWIFFATMFVAILAGVEAIREGLAYGVGAHFNEMKRASGPFGENFRDANRAGVFYAMYLPVFVAALLLLKGKKWLRLAALGGALILVFGIFFTYSRQAIAIAAIMLALLILRRSALWTVIVIVAALNYEVWVPAAVIDRFSETTQTTEYGEEVLDQSTESRFVIWSGAMTLIKEHPFGIGLARFPKDIEHVVGFSKDAHNSYILVTTELGIQGGIALLLVMFACLALGRRIRKKAVTEEDRFVGVGYTVLTVSMMLGNIYGSPFFTGNVMGNFWILTALAARYYQWMGVREKSTAAGERASAHAHQEQERPWGVPAWQWNRRSEGAVDSRG